MESLLNFNFLKDIGVKKNNENNANDKCLSSSEKAFVISQFESIDKEFNDIASDQELNEVASSLEKQKSKKFKNKLNIENTELLLADTKIKTPESNLGFISSKSQKEINSTLDIKKSNFLNVNTHTHEQKILNKNIEKAVKQKTSINILDKNELNNPLSNIENIKINKINSNTQTLLNTGNKSKLKSFFQNYFNFKLKKYSKKNIILKKSHLENFKNYDRKYYQESITILSNKSINLLNKNNISKEEKSNINFDNNIREINHLNENNIKSSNEKYVSNLKENTYDNFDRLKNILDIRNHDIKQRFSQILENNIRMNNNKFEIQLRPENLGKITVTLEITGQNVDININSDNINTIQSLSENNNNLQKMLQNNGMNLNNFNFNGNNNKGANKDKKNNEGTKFENVSVDAKDNNEGDSFMSDKLVYAKA